MADDRWTELCKRWGSQGYDALSTGEKTWINVRSLIDSVENGGVISYFYNSGAATVGDCLEDLRVLGAEGIRVQLERVCALFPDGVPADIDERNDIIDSWPEGDGEDAIDQLLEEIDDNIMPQMAELETNLEAFLERSGLAT